MMKYWFDKTVEKHLRGLGADNKDLKEIDELCELNPDVERFLSNYVYEISSELTYSQLLTDCKIVSTLPEEIIQAFKNIGYNSF